MGTLSMDQDARDAFLGDLHVAMLAVERPDGPPLLAPVWYRYAPGGAVEFTTESDARKAEALREAGRATLSVQREEYPYAYVTVEGPVEISPAERDLRVDIASRYLGPEMGAAYVDQSSGDDIAVALTPERWRTVDYAKLDLPG